VRVPTPMGVLLHKPPWAQPRVMVRLLATLGFQPLPLVQVTGMASAFPLRPMRFQPGQHAIQVANHRIVCMGGTLTLQP
jgi:hypothetical protein